MIPAFRKKPLSHVPECTKTHFARFSMFLHYYSDQNRIYLYYRLRADARGVLLLRS